MHLQEGQLTLPSEILAQVEVGEHVDYQFNPNARMEDLPLVNRDTRQSS
jgi:hypothetical protein